MASRIFQRMPVQGGVADYQLHFDCLDVVPAAHSKFFKDLKLWMSSWRRTFLARNTEASKKSLAKQFFEVRAQQLFGDLNMVEEDAHQMWLDNKSNVVQKYTPALIDMFTHMHELGRKKLDAQRLREKSNKKAREEARKEPKRGSRKKLRRFSSLEPARESRREARRAASTIDNSSSSILERLKTLEDGVHARLAGMEARIHNFIGAATPQTCATISNTTPLEDPQSPATDVEKTTQDEKNGFGSSSSLMSTESPGPPMQAYTNRTTASEFPEGVALADRMIRFFHYAKNHDQEAYESYSKRLRDILVEQVGDRKIRC